MQPLNFGGDYHARPACASPCPAAARLPPLHRVLVDQRDGW